MTFMNFFSSLTILTTILFLDSTTSLEFPPELFNVIYPNFVSNARHPTSNRHRGSYSHALSPALARSPSPMNPANSPSPVSPERSPSPVAPARSPPPLAPARSPPPLAPARSPSSMGPARSPSSMGPATSPSPVIPARLTYPLAPALFVIGDSSVDCGTNNFLGTFARADRPPYGRDFDSHQPTGRFSNGRIPVDYLALRLGLPFVPSYLGQTGSVMDMIRGVNYASAGAGIIFSSGSELGQHISLSQQIQQVMDTFQQFTLSLGVRAANNLMSTSIFYISIGSNDYIHYYLRNVSNVQSLYLPWNFNQFLAQTMKQQIQNLYNANVRNIVVMGLAPLGCAPYYLWLYRSQNGECIEIINNMVLEFNFVMRYMVDEFNHEFRNSNIVFCDAFEGSMDIIQNHDYYGFNVTADACCGLGRYNGWMMCISSDMACSNASNHIWWDQFHPTAAVNGILADNVWSGLHVNMCYPMNLQDMISQKEKKDVRKHRYSEY